MKKEKAKTKKQIVKTIGHYLKLLPKKSAKRSVKEKSDYARNSLAYEDNFYNTRLLISLSPFLDPPTYIDTNCMSLEEIYKNFKIRFIRELKQNGSNL